MCNARDIKVAIKLSIFAATVEKSRPKYYGRFRTLTMDAIRKVKSERSKFATDKQKVSKLTAELALLESDLNEVCGVTKQG